MTLFAIVKNTHPVFTKVLENYFKGISDVRKLQLLNTIKL